MKGSVAADKAEFQLKKWDSINDDDVTNRTQFLGHDSHQYRKNVNFPPVHKEIQNKHNIFIHQLGADVLKARLDEEKQLQIEREALQKKQQKVTKLLRRKIRVTDLEDGGVSISMDQEWDTSTWSEELIQAGCEALILIFYDSSGSSSDERKERAVQMLQKLLYRHTSAEIYVRKNIEMMIGKAANKSIRGGKCGGLLDLLYILHSCKESFLHEMSHANFNGRAIDMLMQEARLAAIIIQHAFRAQRNARRLYKGAISVKKHVGFGSDADIRESRLEVIGARTEELRTKWKVMHCFYPKHVVRQVGGVRGPIHIGTVYTRLALEVVLQLVNESSGGFAHGNREDIVRANGCILLTTFLAAPTGMFSRLAAVILSDVSKVSESFLPMLTSGCIGSAVRCMQYHRSVLGVGQTGLPVNKHDKVSAQGAYEACLDLITNTAVHAAGMYRACMGYRYVTPAHGAVEKVDYRAVVNHLASTAGYGKVRLMDEIKLYLGHQKLLRELSTMISCTNVSELLIRALRCQLTILCTEAHDRAVSEITALQGVQMIRLVELVHHNNIEVGTLALAVFMQICTEHRSRQQLQRVKIESLLDVRDKYYTSAGMVYPFPALHRNIALTGALCRQFNWRYYDPQVVHPIMLGVLAFNDNQTMSRTPGPFPLNKDAVRQMLYLDLLRTMRTTDVIDDERAEQLSIADWVILTNNEPICLGMSKAAAVFGAKALVDFICHPTDANYYESLPLHESAATCVLLEGLSTDIASAALSYSVGTINFMSKYVYLCKYLFLGKRMMNSQIMVILNGVKSAAMALGRYAKSCKQDATVIDSYIKVVQDTELITSMLFFMNTLSISHPKLEKTTRDLQKVVGIGCLDYLNMYAELLLYAQRKTKMAQLSDLYPPAVAITSVSIFALVFSMFLLFLNRFFLIMTMVLFISPWIQLVMYLKMVHKKSDAVVNIFNRACGFLCQVTETVEASTMAIQEWKMFDSLRIYLPTPLSGILPLEEVELSSFLHNTSLDSLETDAQREYTRRRTALEEYKVSLMQLPVSFFTLCANLCNVDEGKCLCFSEGYVRRTLDRINILNSKFIKHCAKFAKNKNSEEWLQFSENVCGCLKFITNAANYNHAKHGSANDLILHELYEFIPLCKNIICWQLHTKVPRTDEALLCAYEALAAVAKDSYRINRLFEKFDLYGVIRHELSMLETLPQRGASAAVKIIDRSCHGLTSKYLVDIIPLLREPLAKVTRIYPTLGVTVRECNWTLTRSSKLYKETVDSSYNPDGNIDHAVEEFIRSGTKHAHARASMMMTASFLQPNSGGNSGAASFALSRQATGLGLLGSTGESGAQNALKLALESVRNADSLHTFSPEHGSPVENGTGSFSPGKGSAEDVETIRPGTYLHCGVSNCGSLLLPDQHKFHGATAALSLAEREQQLLQLTFNDPYQPHLCAVSKLSARSPGLQQRMDENKSKAGFRDIRRYAPPDAGINSTSLPSSPAGLLRPISEKLGNGMQSAATSSQRQEITGSPSSRSYNSCSNLQDAALSPLPSMGGKSLRKLGTSSGNSSLKGSNNNLRSLNSPGLIEKPDKIRLVSLSDLPELALTRPKL